MQRRELPAVSHRRANPQLAVGHSSSPWASAWLSQTRRAISGCHGRSLIRAARRWVCRLFMMRKHGHEDLTRGTFITLLQHTERHVAFCRTGEDAGVGLRGRGHQARRRRLQESVRVADVGSRLLAWDQAHPNNPTVTSCTCRLFQQVVADVFQLPVRLPTDADAAAIGAALQAGAALEASPVADYVNSAAPPLKDEVLH